MNTERSMSVIKVFVAQTFFILANAWLVSVAWCQTSDPGSIEFFESKIRPVLIRECYGCHSDQSGQSKGGLKLDTRQALLLGGDSGSAVLPGDLDESPLWSAINYEDYAMPPSQQLSAGVIEDFRLWIEAGAADPRVPEATGVAIASTVTNEDIERGKQFWSFQPPTNPGLPSIENRDWARSPIDKFILAKLEQHHIQPAADADPHSLLRRLHFDLTGLPPTPEQIVQFVQQWEVDPEAAVAGTVDQLLAQPGFGERWGRHWLDVARFAESTGKELNSTYPHAWRYRDYVIDSFNNDKPYDRFVQEQVAGDLLPVDSDEQWAENLVATGFLAMGPKSLNETNPRQFRADLVDEQIDVTTRVVLGVSVACARCHDHKFDPIPQTDYYAMAGIFGSTETYYGTLDNRQNRRPSDLILLPVEDPNEFENPLSQEELEQLKKDLVVAQQEYRQALQARRQARSSDGQTTNRDTQAIIRSVGATSNRIATIKTVLDAFDDQGKPKTFCMGVQPSDKPVDASLLIRGEVDQPGERVPRGFVSVIGGQQPEISRQSNGRLELAEWMTDETNPLASRVMVNRIWQHLIGQGLVQTTENFGATGLPPTHPELLDYLAVQFMQHDWSIKSMIRQIATSRAYRMSSQFNAEYYERDPDNELVWRATPRRLEAEAIRDAMLSLSGNLDLQRPRASEVARGGSTIARGGRLVSARNQVSRNTMSSDTRMDRDSSDRKDSRKNEGRKRSNRGGQAPNRRADRQAYFNSLPSADPVANYRSVYLPVVRDSIPRSLDVFDFAESSMVVGRRETSNTPDQGLYFLNNPMVMQWAEAFAKRLSASTSDQSEQIQQAFLLAYGRPASESEIGAAEEFLSEFKDDEALSTRRNSLKKLTYLCQSIMAAAEFRIVN